MITATAMPSQSISVIVRTRARPARLAEALASLARQTFRQFEAVIVDMGDEGNRAVVEQASAGLPAVQHLVVSQSLNRPAALNFGIERAAGTLFGVLDDDNLYEPEHLNNLVNGIASTGCDVGYTATRRETYTPEGDLLHVESIHQSPFDYARLLMGNFIYATSMACRRRLWERLGGYDARFPVYEDWDFLIRCGAIGRVEPVDGCTAVSRSFTGRPDMPEHHREMDDCQRCAIGLRWVHRATRRRILPLRPDLVGSHEEPLPRHGVHADHLPILRDWWSRGRNAGPPNSAALRVLSEPFGRPGIRRLMVFGHPGHELALFGVLQRYRPQIVVITDGGSAARMQESQVGLASIGMLERTIYLGYSEASFYTALLDGDVELFADVVRRLRSLIVEQRPEQIFCDAVEFYNPVHDITMPLVRAAVDERPVDIYEVPLVYQKDEPEETYEIQRVPAPLAAHRIVHVLTPAEVERKTAARNEIYRSLHDQAGPVFLAVSREHLGREEMAAAVPGALSPAATGRALRYEWRARLLHEQGAIERTIGFSDHYLPMAERLVKLRLNDFKQLPVAVQATPARPASTTRVPPIRDG